MTQKYVVTIKPEYVRDTQVYVRAKPDDIDDLYWGDYPDVEVFLEIIEGPVTPDIMVETASRHGLDVNAVKFKPVFS